MGLNKKKSNAIICQVEEIANHAKEYFDKVNIKEQTAEAIMAVMRSNSIRE